MAVPSPGTNVTPLGSAPDSVMAGLGEPVARIRSVLLFPTIMSPLDDVIDGATGGFVAPAGAGTTVAAISGAATIMPDAHRAATRRLSPAVIRSPRRMASRY